MQAVSFIDSKYEIDRDMCVECGLCEKLCPTCSIIDEEDDSKPSPHEKIIRECDLVVCGGGSGIITAIKAAQLGKKVILLEKAKRVGGKMCLSCVIQLDRIKPNTDVDCSEFINWFLEFPGTKNCISFEGNNANEPFLVTTILKLSERVENKLCKDATIGPGWIGSLIKNIMLTAIHAQKLDVEILLENEAYNLKTGSEGRVTGVIARDPGGETEIMCNSVIIATGGFSARDENQQKCISNYFTGGLDIDLNCRVLDNKSKYIPGLYA